MCKSQVLSKSQVTVIGHQANSANEELDRSLDHEANTLETTHNLAVVSSEKKCIISNIAATNSSLVNEPITMRKELAARNGNKRQIQGDKSCNHCCWSRGTYCDYKSKKITSKRMVTKMR